MLPTPEAPTRSVPGRGRSGSVAPTRARGPFPAASPASLHLRVGGRRAEWSLPPAPQSWGGGAEGGVCPAPSSAGGPVQGGGQPGGRRTEAFGVQVSQGPRHRPWPGAATGGWREPRGRICRGSWTRAGVPAAAGGGGAQRGGGGVHAGGGWASAGGDSAWGGSARWWGWGPSVGGACTLGGGRGGIT